MSSAIINHRYVVNALGAAVTTAWADNLLGKVIGSSCFVGIKLFYSIWTRINKERASSV